MNTKDKGNIAETVILSEFVKAGFQVSVPWGENSRYDLLVDVDGRFIRVQCKTGILRKGCVQFRTNTVYKLSTGNVVRGYTKSEIDYFAVYCRDTGDVYLVGVEDTPKGNASLRVQEPSPEYRHSNSPIKWAKDYLFGTVAERLRQLPAKE